MLASDAQMNLRKCDESVTSINAMENMSYKKCNQQQQSVFNLPNSQQQQQLLMNPLIKQYKVDDLVLNPPHPLDPLFAF